MSAEDSDILYESIAKNIAEILNQDMQHVKNVTSPTNPRNINTNSVNDSYIVGKMEECQKFLTAVKEEGWEAVEKFMNTYSMQVRGAQSQMERSVNIARSFPYRYDVAARYFEGRKAGLENIKAHCEVGLHRRAERKANREGMIDLAEHTPAPLRWVSWSSTPSGNTWR